MFLKRISTRFCPLNLFNDEEKQWGAKINITRQKLFILLTQFINCKTKAESFIEMEAQSHWFAQNFINAFIEAIKESFYRNFYWCYASFSGMNLLFSSLLIKSECSLCHTITVGALSYNETKILSLFYLLTQNFDLISLFR